MDVRGGGGVPAIRFQLASLGRERDSVGDQEVPLAKKCEVHEGSGCRNQSQVAFYLVAVSNNGSVMALLKQLFRQCRGRGIHLLDDNGWSHKGPDVMEWVEKNSGKMELHFLPTHSAELNAAEYVWEETGGKTTHNHFFLSVDRGKEKLFRRFNRVQGNPAPLRNALASFA